MSENPYQSAPISPNLAGVAIQPKSAGLKVIPIICLVLGVLGVLGSVWGIVMLMFQGSFSAMQSVDPGSPAADFQLKMQEMQQAQFIPNLILSVCNIIVGSLLVAGSIGALGLKEWGRKLLRNALLIAAIFVVLRGIYGIWVQYSMLGWMQEMLSVQGQGGNEATMTTVIQVSMLVGLVIGLAWVGALAGFYIWGRLYFEKQTIKDTFDKVN